MDPPPDLPAVTVTFAGLRHSVSATREIVDDSGPGTKTKRQKQLLEVLHVCCGELLPGSSTLLLASPGAGSSTFLRIIAGRQCPSAGRCVRYNGRTLSELEARGVSMRKLAVYCGERDEHEPLLTVLETLRFVHRSAVAPIPAGQRGLVLPPLPPVADRLVIGRVENRAVGSYLPPDEERMMSAMGLSEAADTLIGSALIRGISGGQKRRVTLAEALLTNARIVCLDQPTTGLDSATAYACVKYACDWAHSTGGVLVATLQQAGPELSC